MSTEILNGKITFTRLGEEHGCLSANLIIEGDGWGCGFGGYCLDHWCAKAGEHSSSDGYGAIIELMKILEVDFWEDLKDSTRTYCPLRSSQKSTSRIFISSIIAP